MIELGTGTTPADNAASDLIQDVTEETFMKEVRSGHARWGC